MTWPLVKVNDFEYMLNDRKAECFNHDVEL
jgi:hypothetical protein